jgi:2'-5' RNA ligase
MRTFAAFELPEKAKKDIFQIITYFQSLNVKGINWVSFENLHITLQFFGETNKQNINSICKLLSSEVRSFPVFECINPQIQIIPFNKPKVLWLHFQTSQFAGLAVDLFLRQPVRRNRFHRAGTDDFSPY